MADSIIPKSFSWGAVLVVVVALAIFGYTKKLVTKFVPTATEYLPS